MNKETGQPRPDHAPVPNPGFLDIQQEFGIDSVILNNAFFRSFFSRPERSDRADIIAQQEKLANISDEDLVGSISGTVEDDWRKEPAFYMAIIRELLKRTGARMKSKEKPL